VIEAWFIEQPPRAKKMYITIVIAREAKYIKKADPIKSAVQTLDSVVSIFSWQYSAQLWAKSTRRIRPISRKRHAPISAK
jgi:hypothetical protein